MRRIIFALGLGLLLFWAISSLQTVDASDALRQATQDLQKSLKANDITQAKDAVNRIAALNTERAIKVLLKIIPTIPPGNYEAYWTLLNGLTPFAEPEALEELAKFILRYQKQPRTRDVLYIMKSNLSPNLIPFLARILEKGTKELQILALDHLARFRIKASAQTIVNFLKKLRSHKQPGLKDKALESLRDLLGKNIGDDPAAWIAWWEENQDKPDVIVPPFARVSNTETTVEPPDDDPEDWTAWWEENQAKPDVIVPPSARVSDTEATVEPPDKAPLTDYDRLKQLPEDKIIAVTFIMNSHLIPLLANTLEKGLEKPQDSASTDLTAIRNKASAQVIVNLLDANSKVWISWGEEYQDKPDVTTSPVVSASNTGTVVDQFGYARFTEYDYLKCLPKDKIIVITGECAGCQKYKGLSPEQSRHDFDRIELMLKQMNIPHTPVPKNEFDKDSYSLKDRLVLIFNCNFWREHCVAPGHQPREKTGLRVCDCYSPDGSPHIPYSNKLSDRTMQKIRKFVEQGGFVFSEDWELEEVVERAFPGILDHTKYYPNDTDVKILPAPGQSAHPYLKGVFERVVKEEAPWEGGQTRSVIRRELKVGEGKWKIDADSPNIKILKPSAVTLLIVSPELKKDEKETGAVAVTFAYSKGSPRGIKTSRRGEVIKPGGQVLHVLSHFGKQIIHEDEFVLQNLLLNFLFEASQRYRTSAPAPKKKR